MTFKTKIFPALLVSAGFVFTGQSALATENSPTVADEIKPTALGGGMYLMKEGGVWGSVMHLNEPHAGHPGAPAPHGHPMPKKEEKAPASKNPKDVRPDLCVASDQNQALILRADAKALEVRSIGKEWSLKKNFQTDVRISVGKDYHEDFTMMALDKDQLGTPVTLVQMAILVDALSKNDEAVLTYLPKDKKEAAKTKAEIRKVSLKLAAPVLANFRECVRFSGFSHIEKSKASAKKSAQKA